MNTVRVFAFLATAAFSQLLWATPLNYSGKISCTDSESWYDNSAPQITFTFSHSQGEMRVNGKNYPVKLHYQKIFDPIAHETEDAANLFIYSQHTTDLAPGSEIATYRYMPFIMELETELSSTAWNTPIHKPLMGITEYTSLATLGQGDPGFIFGVYHCQIDLQ